MNLVFAREAKGHDALRASEFAHVIQSVYGFDADVRSEIRYHLVFDRADARLSNVDFQKLEYLLGSNLYDPDSRAENVPLKSKIIEVGPRPEMTTPFSTNAVAALRAAGIHSICRVEHSTCYLVASDHADRIDPKTLFSFIGDPMMQCLYNSATDFVNHNSREKVYEINVLADNGMDHLRNANTDLGLAFDDDDLEYYFDLFKNKLKKNPTDVELFDLAQSNSEHSRHWFFRGQLNVNGRERPECLFKSIIDTQRYSNSNNVIAFCDNSSAIRGSKVNCLLPTDSKRLSLFDVQSKIRHIIYTAETHNFPTGVCPFPGAATGTGGRIRDIQATGRGAHEIAGVAGYSVGNLHLDDYIQPWEDSSWDYPSNFASPVKILIDASNGASDYGNKFGEPVICGFTRTFGMKVPGGKILEYIKPIMFSGGVGAIDDECTKKADCQPGMLVCKVGGPVYRIGVGGGAASSTQVQGDQKEHLDFNAVQRGDPQMEQKMHRVIRACVELPEGNPILSIHDQGAGGNGNVIKEIIEGKNGGAVISADKFELGDPTISIRELWGAEYQESNALLIAPKSRATVEAISEREKCTFSVVGEITGDNKVVVKNFKNELPATPVNLNLHQLNEREMKKFNLTSEQISLKPLVLPKGLTVREALERVLRLPSVASKRFLTNKVDRSVTGLIAQQQCVGPLHTPVADVAVTALSFYDTFGAAVAVGEQPVKGLLDPAAGARMSVGEALTNLIFAPITELQDVKCSGNWMWAAKVNGEGGKLVEACDAMCAAMKTLGIAIDGGKDSLSMAARCPDGSVVCAPGTLVISAYAPCVNIEQVVTPDLKIPDVAPTQLIYISMANKRQKCRLGGSALAQCYGQLGSDVPDLDDPAYFARTFEVVQSLIKTDSILSGHDVSDGGLITTLLEMAFAGNCHINVSIDCLAEPLEALFAEELGIVLEVAPKNLGNLLVVCQENRIFAQHIGEATQLYGADAAVIVKVNGRVVLEEALNVLRDIWEATSDRLELLQTDAKAVAQQIRWRSSIKKVEYTTHFWEKFIDDLSPTGFNQWINMLSEKPKVAILREEGSNGDREMAAAFTMAGFDAFDLTMTDLENGTTLEAFRGLVFVGGFSFADVFGSGKGWSAALKFDSRIRQTLNDFKQRKNTFSLGICNGCQLMALINWIGDNKEISGKVRLEENDCGRFHSGFCTVRINKSPSIMLQDMENSILGVWTSHGEGKFTYESEAYARALETSNLRCIRYCDDNSVSSTLYPQNPNGSVNGIAGICSADGRHLAMMPHPDRSFLTWQWPNYPSALRLANSNFSPWMKMYRNAFDWCQKL